jgi:hypothetical protein
LSEALLARLKIVRPEKHITINLPSETWEKKESKTHESVKETEEKCTVPEAAEVVSGYIQELF